MASVRRWGGGDPTNIVNGVEAAGTQAYKAGDLVKFTSGTVAIATAGAIHGIALKDAAGVTSTAAPIELIDYNAVYEVDYKNSAPAQSVVGTMVDATFTAGAHTWDESGASTDAYCVGFTTAAATDAKILIRFIVDPLAIA